jgi:bacillopeptidase F (M6 metalloprotease family)
VDRTTSDEPGWVWREYDVSAYLGQTVTLVIGAKNDGDDDTAAMYVDEVALEVCP